MSIAEHIKKSLVTPTQLVNVYLSDLSDDDLLLKPAEGINPINWQVGHLIASEHQLIEAIAPGSMPALPEGFTEIYDRKNSSGDDTSAFLPKEELVKLMNEQREGTLAVLAKMSDEDLMKPGPEQLQQIGETVGSIFAMQGTHWTMHAGQWVIVRRQQGKPVLI
ncbi:DinB superfamily protein [Polystyrenella longa]|uniref:DinB superfamily protein n=1 Tax=Polystyrenella longa TaxID=2528007 RepID=A0A518CH93_9PLAN|nr:DinB family protein [Polystyrenella longa]QDU78598.1 DinB superfamily protein [Polystyrenella longa]